MEYHFLNNDDSNNVSKILYFHNDDVFLTNVQKDQSPHNPDNANIQDYVMKVYMHKNYLSCCINLSL